MSLFKTGNGDIFEERRLTRERFNSFEFEIGETVRRVLTVVSSYSMGRQSGTGVCNAGGHCSNMQHLVRRK